MEKSNQPTPKPVTYPILDSLAQVLMLLPPEEQKKLEWVGVGIELGIDKPKDQEIA